MKRKRLKNYLKLGTLLIGIVMLAQACQKDDAIGDEPLRQTEFKVTLVSKTQYSKNQIVNDIVGALPKQKDAMQKTNTNTQAKTTYVDEYDFYIKDEQAYHITSNDYESFTFEIKRPQDNGLLENMVLNKYADGSYNAFIMKYDVTEAEKQSIVDGITPVGIGDKTSIEPLPQVSNSDSAINPVPIGNTGIYHDYATGNCYFFGGAENLGGILTITWVSTGCTQEVADFIANSSNPNDGGGGSNDDSGTDPGTGADPGNGNDNGNDTNPGDFSSGGNGNTGNPDNSGNNDSTSNDDNSPIEDAVSEIGGATKPIKELVVNDDCLPNINCRQGEIMDEDCECRIDLEDPCANKDLRNYEIATEIVSTLESRQQPNTMVQSSELVDSFILETIDDGWGDINQDRFSIKIDELPNGYTPFQLFNEVRMNFTNLVVGGDVPYVTDVTLEPYSDQDGITWNSNNPVGAAMDFDTIFDTSTVYCVEYNEDEMYWIFATVTSYDHQGHFVAGVRQFGLEPNGSGGYSFYVRAADRLGGVLDYVANGLSGDEEVLFTQAADKTWKNLMENTTALIQNQGGTVEEFDETKTYGARHPYDEDDCQD
ncbi:hypothetical protein [Winogradskyella sediminis]|uniref:Uncharacterized protein n=1 Tax=Winogradskyella sediminis TaxID=1382466 RepID=A0A1H1WMG1_9FLAO|nr:hypothetical protein [Winogradskyella sediminis]SDS98202.1 hypothetical protein SAMN04489797_2927 [Winogradskyella sediminis]